VIVFVLFVIFLLKNVYDALVKIILHQLKPRGVSICCRVEKSIILYFSSMSIEIYFAK
jgi:hypothetical protein